MLSLLKLFIGRPLESSIPHGPHFRLDSRQLRLVIHAQRFAGLENIEGTASAFRDETGAPVGVLSTIYDRDGSRDGRREDTGRLNRLYAHSISRSLGFRDPN